MTNTTTYEKLTFKYKWKQKIKTGKHLYLEKSTLTNLTKQKRILRENTDFKNNFSNTSQQ